MVKSCHQKQPSEKSWIESNCEPQGNDHGGNCCIVTPVIAFFSWRFLHGYLLHDPVGEVRAGCVQTSLSEAFPEQFV